MKKHPGFCILLGLHPHYGQSPFPRSVLRIASPSAPGIAVEFPPAEPRRTPRSPSLQWRGSGSTAGWSCWAACRAWRLEPDPPLEPQTTGVELCLDMFGPKWGRGYIGLLEQEVWQHCLCMCVLSFNGIISCRMKWNELIYIYIY